MKPQRLRRLLLAALCVPPSLALAGAETGAPAQPAIPGEKPLHKFLSVEDKSKLSYAYQWLDIMQETTARDVERNAPRPTIISRSMAIWATAVYDAWAAYDEKAVGSRLGGSLRRPKAEHTLENKKKAISYASYHSLLYSYPPDKDFLDAEMKRMGYDPAVISKDPATPEGIGFLAATALIEYRRHDGANQHGDETGCDGQPYSDYTFYRPVNPPDKILDPDRWQPIEFTLANGKHVTPGFLTPHWYRVKPFVMETAAQFRPPPPPKTTTDPETLKKEAAQVLAYNNSLTNEQKAVVEFMRDGPRSTGQSGHWLRFAQDVSRRDRNSIDQDVKLYFVVANVAMDAFISCWETKRVYDSSRPWTLIHYFYKGQTIKGWAGIGGGVKDMPAEDWHPYSPLSFITPPFPGYTSGHATVSAACAKSIALFTGSDSFGFMERRPHCELTEKVSGQIISIDLNTWSQTAEMAALSRALGGYHIPVDNNIGLKVGRQIADWSWPKYQEYFNGTAKVRP
ncbi:MAG TPA: vanadium-dependent haloperoxidase [Verrucomicrobiales bacterium]|nr:vanadium-dependent haloperoxidase [Verrucomicrobiales bacterium]